MNRLLLLVLTLLSFSISSFADDTWTVAGSRAVFGSEWGQTDTNNDMTSVDGVVYTLTKTGVSLVAGTTYEYKVVKNHAWNEAYPSSNKTFTVNFTSTYDVTITFNATTHAVSEELTEVAAPVGGRARPVLPTGVAPESGQTYYLYNVQEQKFLCRSTTGNSYPALGGMNADKVTITSTGSETAGESWIQWASNAYYWAAYDTYIYSSYNTDGANSKFVFAESSKGYTFQRSPSNTDYYKADEFVGYNGSNGDRLTPALAEGSIHWLFLTVEDAEYYLAKLKLYTYLAMADQYNFYITQYEEVYNNPASTTAELDLAQATLSNALAMSNNYVSPSWTEYPILFQNTTDNKWMVDHDDNRLYWEVYKGGNGLETTSTLKATVNVDADATMCYSYYGNQYATMRVLVDGELVQVIWPNQSTDERRYYIELSPGKHDITWTCLYNNAATDYSSWYYHYLYEIGIVNTPTLYPATTTVEGQLGTEILKLIDPISKTRKVVITGVIGDDDWTTIGLMKNAFSIDMSGATATAPIPDEMFTKSNFDFLHDIKLPQGLTAIGDRAFLESDVESEITFPETLTSIGESAFYGTKIKAAHMPEGLTAVGQEAFSYCYYLENATWPSSAATVSGYCFQDCHNLRTFTIPEGVTEIESDAFYGCHFFNPRFPSTLKNISTNAFYDTATDSLFISENLTVDRDAFDHCNNLVYAEWPTSFYDAGGYGVVTDCWKLNKVKLMSPTVVTNNSSFFSGNTLGNITLVVPDFLVATYKLAPYWSLCKVEGFNSADLTEWNVKQALVLNAGQRIGGTPTLWFNGQNSSLTVNGDDTQTIGQMGIDYCPISQFWSGTDAAGEYVSGSISQRWGMMLGNTDKVNITGELCEWLISNEKEWYFMTLPFDTKVSDIVCTAYDNNAATSFAIRYYDGANRATFGTGSNWKNFSKDDIIPAGTGFIIQTAKAAYTKFTAQDNASKQNILSNREFVKALEANPSDVTADKGWNLVGNPWQTFYNIHKLNFTAPITVWNYDYNRYDAYSIIDDDYAIKPLEAIFVQCPDEQNSISFPIDGRQLTNVIESQSGARPFGPVAESERRLIDIELTNGELTDKTRFVLNPKAKMDYETTCDASKFFSMDGNVPQIYTVENGVQMAINERPEGDGTVTVGLMIPAGGTYTIESKRNELATAILVDLQNGTETNLNTDSYTFSAEAGKSESRFVLRLMGAGQTTGIQTIDHSSPAADSYYNLNGQRVSAPQKGLYIANGKKAIVK